MEDKKVNELVMKIDVFIEKIKNDREFSKAFLQKAGIVDREGKLKDRYKNLYLFESKVN